MKAIYFSEKEKVNENDIDKVALEILNGKSVIFPTETVYGVGTNALEEDACNKIFEIKGRPKEKPFIVLISDFEMLNKIVCNISNLEMKLMKRFWPGPLTIVLEKDNQSKIPNVVTAGKSSIAIRMTSGKIVRQLIEKSGVPIIAPSANLSGKPTGVKMENIISELGDKVDYICL